ncbi:MAG: hypothetical protein ACKVK0_16505, partial [Pirellulales bacterium]
MCMLQKILPISLCLLFTLPALGDEDKDPQTPQPMEMASAFDKDILPILKSRCIECHGGATPKASLDLRTVTAILQG